MVVQARKLPLHPYSPYAGQTFYELLATWYRYFGPEKCRESLVCGIISFP